MSGDVTVNAIAGRAKLQTVSGELHATDLGGEVRAQNVSGDSRSSASPASCNVQTVSGEMKLRGVKSSYVRTETVSGDLEFDGAVDPKGRYEFHSHSGGMTITLPRGAGATVSMRGFSGELQQLLRDDAGAEQPHRRAARTRAPRSRIGGGGARFNIETFSGDVEIKGCGTTKSKED